MFDLSKLEFKRETQTKYLYNKTGNTFYKFTYGIWDLPYFPPEYKIPARWFHMEEVWTLKRYDESRPKDGCIICAGNSHIKKEDLKVWDDYIEIFNIKDYMPIEFKSVSTKPVKSDSDIKGFKMKIEVKDGKFKELQN